MPRGLNSIFNRTKQAAQAAFFMLRKELEKILLTIKSIDKKVALIFVSVAILQTISWYHTSRLFFRANQLGELLGLEINERLLEFLFWFTGDFLVFFVIPILIICLLFREKVSSFGLNFLNRRAGFEIALIFIGVMLPILWCLSAVSSFTETYPHLQIAKIDWNLFLFYEAGMAIYLFAWEFVWRGYMLFGLEEKFGIYAIFIQMIPFVILHNGKPELETFSAILGGLALGYLALRTRSFLYGFFIHFGIMIIIDLISVIRFRTNFYGIFPF